MGKEGRIPHISTASHTQQHISGQKHTMRKQKTNQMSHCIRHVPQMGPYQRFPIPDPWTGTGHINANLNTQASKTIKKEISLEIFFAKGKSEETEEEPLTTKKKAAVHRQDLLQI